MHIVSYYHPIEMIPPVISLLRLLKHNGDRVAYIGVTYTEKTVSVLEEMGIPFNLMQRWPCVRFSEHPILRIWYAATGWFRRTALCRWFQRRFLWRTYHEYIRDKVKEEEVVFWTVNTWVTALWGDRVLSFGKRHIQWLTEFGEEVGAKWSGFSIDKMFHSATLIESEINRSRLLAEDKGLTTLPFVLPNKPFGHPRTRRMTVTDSGIARQIDTWKGKRVFLYQGSLGSDRIGIINMIEYLCEGFPESIVAVMSHWSPIVDELALRYSNFSYVPFLCAPYHLEVTSHADIGLAVYSITDGKGIVGISPLNALYCAPNKTFEYTGFGIPMLCNNPPGLRDSIGAYGAAVCLDELCKENVIDGAKRLLDDYQTYSRNAVSFFESVDVEEIVHKIIDFATA